LEIDAYFAQIKATIDRYTAATFIVSSNIAFETRPGNQGYLSGKIEFADGSTLHFREYLDGVGESIEKVMYSYHYQDARAKMILRYDNAAHRPALATSNHKHDSTGIQSSSAPMLEAVLSEIAIRQHWA
jgi:hypothetical protein